MKNVLLTIFLIFITACESPQKSNGFARGYDGPWKIGTQAGVDVVTELDKAWSNKDFEKTLSLLSNNSLGKLEWIEYRELNKGAQAFKEIHDGTCSAPKIILIP